MIGRSRVPAPPERIRPLRSCTVAEGYRRVDDEPGRPQPARNRRRDRQLEHGRGSAGRGGRLSRPPRASRRRVTIVDNDSRREQRELLARGCPRRAARLLARRTSATARPPTERCVAARRAGLRQQRRRRCQSPGPWRRWRRPRGGATHRDGRAGLRRRYRSLPRGAADSGRRCWRGSSPAPSRRAIIQPDVGQRRSRSASPRAPASSSARALGADRRLRRGLLPLVRGRRPGQAAARQRLPQPRRRRRPRRARRRGGLRPDRSARASRRSACARCERYIRLHHRRATPIAAPLLRLSRRLRAGGAR